MPKKSTMDVVLMGAVDGEWRTAREIHERCAGTPTRDSVRRRLVVLASSRKVAIREVGGLYRRSGPAPLMQFRLPQ